MTYELIRRWGVPLVLLGLLWTIMSRGAADSWVVGFPTCLLALAAFDRLRERRVMGIRPRELPGFAAWFLWQSLRGGLEVAKYAVEPRMPLHPGFLRYRLSVPAGPARVFLINCLSLLPGTLSANIEGDELVLHALDDEADVIAETRNLECRVQALYGISGGDDHG